MFESHKPKKYLKLIFIIFMCLQPFLDIYWLYTDKIINIFKFSPATIIRSLVMIVLIIFAFLWCKNTKKYIYGVIMIIVYGVYIIFHHFNALNFSVPYGYFNYYSLAKELFYFIRMIFPLALIYITYDYKIDYNIFKKIVVIVCYIFSICMIVSNLFGFAMASYGGGNFHISINFFNWFKEGIYSKYAYTLVASKGIFHMANQISGILIALLPFLVYFVLKDKKIVYIIDLVLTIFSMIMLGTRVASVGWLFVCVFMFLLYLFFCFIKKEQKFSIFISLIYLVIVVIFLLILPYSPVMNRVYVSDSAKYVETEITKDENTEEVESFKEYLSSIDYDKLNEEDQEELRRQKVSFVEKYHVSYGFDLLYSEQIYPYNQDVDFWISEMDIPYVLRADHRQLKTDITKRIISLNDNWLDYVFGISFTALRNAPCYMENDIFVHLYSIGIIGIVLFIFPYFLVFVYSIIIILKNIKERFTFLNVSLITSIALIFIAGILSGNVFDELICTFFLGFICGFLLLNINKKI